jgi:uncharacterized repeat protein (TIGR02543 family)
MSNQAKTRNLFSLGLLLSMLIASLMAVLGGGTASASISSITDDGSNSSGWTGDAYTKAGVGNPDEAFTFGKNELMSHTLGDTGADFAGSSIKFDIKFNHATDYLGLWWGRGVNVGSGIANGLYMGPAGNPDSTSSWMSGYIGIVPNMNGPCSYYCAGGIEASTISWDVNRWYTVEVKISANSTSYFVDGQLIQSLATSLPVANFVTFGGDDRNGWGFTDGVYLDNIEITPPPFRTITYSASDSTDLVPTQADAQEGSSFSVGSAVSRSLYDFAGWSDGNNLFQPGSQYLVGSSNVTLTATWQPKTYQLNFDSNGGSAVAASTFDNVNYFVEPASPVRAGYTFVGWALTQNGEPLSSSYVFTDTAPVTVFAKWSSDSVSLNFDSAGGSPVDPISYEIGTSISSAPTDPTRAGYVFNGWQVAANGPTVTFPYFPVLTEALSLAVTSASLTDLGDAYVNVGRWDSNTWYGPKRPENHPRDVVSYSNGLKYVAIRESKNTVIGVPPTPDGYYLLPLATSTTLIASWSLESQTVTYDLDGGDGVAPTQVAVDSFSSFVIADPATRSGFTFTGWSDGSREYQPGETYQVGVLPVALTASWTTLTFTTDGNNNVTVTGCGSSCPANLVIPSTLGGNSVTKISAGAFASQGLTSVTLPDSVTRIGGSAFRGNQLSSLNLPNALQVLGAYSFADNNLSSVRFSVGLGTIGSGAFYGNVLTSVSIPNSVTTIGTSAFRNNSLSSVTLPNTITNISNYVFWSNELTSISIPNSVTRIGDGAFGFNGLSSATVPDSVTSIGTRAFVGNSLTSITLGTGLTRIGAHAFSANAITSVTIPDNVTSIGSYAFKDNQISSLTLGSSLVEIGAHAFRNNRIASVSIPASVTSIGAYAFRANGLGSLNVPQTVTSQGIRLK